MKFYCAIKRILDCAFVLVTLPFSAFVISLCSLCILLEDGLPIFYRARRVGYKGKIFTMLKLRSMTKNAPDLGLEDGSTFSSASAPRVTRCGRILRKYSLDEVPQVFNVLIGQMSFIGWRPDSAYYLQHYTDEERIILSVRPGITGYNQVINRNTVGTKEKLRNDVHYVKHLSFLLDCKIFFLTIFGVMSRKGVYRG